MIDIERLREDLMNFFGTAKEIYPTAVIELYNVEHAGINQLNNIAENNGFNIDNYIEYQIYG